MTLRRDLLDRIAEYRAATGLSERQFGLRVAGTSSLLARLRAGKASLRTIEAIETSLYEFRAAPQSPGAARHPRTSPDAPPANDAPRGIPCLTR